MAGIYVHIPFCRQACAYCDFHFSTLHRDREAMPGAIIEELAQRSSYLETKALESIYFGGGTPSILPPDKIQMLLTAFRNHFEWPKEAEITLEANPDDLSPDYLQALSHTEVNRLSIGVQSFKNEDLKLMNRAHNAAEAKQSVQLLRTYGFEDFSIDLIYGLPEQTNADWQWQLEQLLEYDIPHFSAYALTVEPKTALAKWVEKGELKVDEGRAAEHFAILQEFAARHHYRHYELSNFAQAGKEAKHNSSYWQDATYLGLGPAAHSYNGKDRHANIANNALYLKGVESGNLAMTEEKLNLVDRYNEWLMIGLRLKEGLEVKKAEGFGGKLSNYFRRQSEILIQEGRLHQQEGRLFIPAEHRFFSDGIAAALFFIAEDYGS